MEWTVLEHSFRELPAIDESGRFLGMIAVKSSRSIPQAAWSETSVTAIIDRAARTVCAGHSMATVEKALALGHHDYVPVVDPATDQLIGILSSTDILRARQHAQEQTAGSHAKVMVIPVQQKASTP